MIKGKPWPQIRMKAVAIEKMMVMLLISTKINAALESARITIAYMKSIMASDKHSHLSKFVITTSQLSEIIDNIYLKRKKDIPMPQLLKSAYCPFVGEPRQSYHNNIAPNPNRPHAPEIRASCIR